MKTMIIIAFASLVICSCKKEDIRSYHPEVDYIIDEFVQDGLKYGRKVDITKLKAVVLQGDFPHDSLLNGYGLDGIVYLDTTSFRYKHSKKYLIYHELGHVLLNRSHYKTPHSIMNGLPRDWDYNQEFYIQELFTQSF